MGLGCTTAAIDRAPTTAFTCAHWGLTNRAEAKCWALALLLLWLAGRLEGESKKTRAPSSCPCPASRLPVSSMWFDSGRSEGECAEIATSPREAAAASCVTKAQLFFVPCAWPLHPPNPPQPRLLQNPRWSHPRLLHTQSGHADPHPLPSNEWPKGGSSLLGYVLRPPPCLASYAHANKSWGRRIQGRPRSREIWGAFFPPPAACGPTTKKPQAACVGALAPALWT